MQISSRLAVKLGLFTSLLASSNKSNYALVVEFIIIFKDCHIVDTYYYY